MTGVLWCRYHQRFEVTPFTKKHLTPEKWAETYWKFKGSRNE